MHRTCPLLGAKRTCRFALRMTSLSGRKSGHALLHCKCLLLTQRRHRIATMPKSVGGRTGSCAMTFGTKTRAVGVMSHQTIAYRRHRHVQRPHRCCWVRRYRCSSSPVRPPLTPIHGALPTELRAATNCGFLTIEQCRATLSGNGRFLRAKPILHRT